MIVEIIVRENGSKFDAFFRGVQLGTFRTPLLSSARLLVSKGVDPSLPITMRHEGSNVVALRSTIGAAARLDVTGGAGHERFVPYDPDRSTGVTGDGQV